MSSCLLGERVRYDGGHKRSVCITGRLAEHFELVPVCPEVGIGLGVPRPPIQLVGSIRAPCAVGVDDPALDVTARLKAYASGTAGSLGDISGYLYKSRSPSCGTSAVPVYPRGGGPPRPGMGIYARALTRALPLVPYAEDDWLADPVRLEHFIERVFAYRRWQEFVSRPVTAARLRAFHERQALALIAHSAEDYASLTRRVAAGGPTGRVVAAYAQAYMRALRRPVGRAGHARALTLALRTLPRTVPGEACEVARRAIADYRRGHLTLAAARASLETLLARFPATRLREQSYLAAHPSERILRGWA